MSKSYKKLVYKARYGSINAQLELSSRSYIFTGLSGIFGESIVFRYSDDIVRYKNIILCGEISKCEDSVLLDAFSSATIEGARTTIEDVKKCITSPVTKSDKMVVNAFKCQNFVYDNDITKDNIHDIWKMIINDVCENERVRGRFYRDGMVYVGSHIPEVPDKIESQMNSLFDFCAGFDDKYVKACIVHFYVAYIHPFCDGNGRLSRIWMNKILYDVNQDFKNLVISREIENSVRAYYVSLQESEYSYNGLIDITSFIEYILGLIADKMN